MSSCRLGSMSVDGSQLGIANKKKMLREEIRVSFSTIFLLVVE